MKKFSPQPFCSEFIDDLIEKHQSQFKLYATRKCRGSLVDPDDALQQFYHKWMRKCCQVRVGYSTKGPGYLFKMLERTCLDEIDKMNCYRKKLDDFKMMHENKELKSDPFKHEKFMAYCKILKGKLTSVDYELFIMYLEGYSYKELASYFGISIESVGVKIYRTKKKLKNTLGL